MAKKYTCPPQQATADNTFSDNLVGFQIVDGGGLTQGNFDFTVSITEKSNREFVVGTFSSPITLDSMGMVSIEESKAIIEKNFQVYPNFDLSKVTAFSQYGSLVKRMAVSLTKIVNFFPASIDVFFKQKNYLTGSTATNISYDTTNNQTTFSIDLATVVNPFGIDFTVNAARNLSLSEIPISQYRDMVTNSSKYSLYLSGVNYDISFLTPTQSLTAGTLTLTVNGNPFSGQTTSYSDLNIRLNPMTTEMVFIQDFDEVEKFILNRKNNPIYTAYWKSVV